MRGSLLALGSCPIVAAQRRRVPRVMLTLPLKFRSGVAVCSLRCRLTTPVVMMLLQGQYTKPLYQRRSARGVRVLSKRERIELLLDEIKGSVGR